MTGQSVLPFQVQSETSRDAATMGVPFAVSQRERVYHWLVANGPATDKQMQAALNMDGSTQRPRRVELMRAGRIVDWGKRKQENGRSATVWRAW